METHEERFAKGMEVRRKLAGGQPPGESPAGFDLVPGLDEFVTASLFGDVWSRPGLDIKSRCLITMAAHAVLGDREMVLRNTIRWSLNVGLTKEEIGEALMHLAFYGGLPTTVNALRLAREVFEERDT